MKNCAAIGIDVYYCEWNSDRHRWEICATIGIAVYVYISELTIFVCMTTNGTAIDIAGEYVQRSASLCMYT
jgi:hypothetical protein